MLAPGLLHGWGGSGGKSEAKLGIRAPQGLELGGPISYQARSIVNFSPGSGAVLEDWVVPPNAGIIRIIDVCTIDGIAAGFDGQMLFIENGGAAVTFRSNQSSSKAGNRIIVFGSNTGGSLQLLSGDCALLIYDLNNRDGNTATFGAHWKVAWSSAKSWNSASTSITMNSTTGNLDIGTTSTGVLILHGVLSISDGSGLSGSPGQALVNDGTTGGSQRTIWGDLEPTPHYLFAR